MTDKPPSTSINPWEQAAAEQRARNASATPYQRLQMLEAMVLFAHEFCGAAWRGTAAHDPNKPAAADDPPAPATPIEP